MHGESHLADFSYTAILRLHLNYEIDECAGVMAEIEDPSDIALNGQLHTVLGENDEREGP